MQFNVGLGPVDRTTCTLKSQGYKEEVCWERERGRELTSRDTWWALEGKAGGSLSHSPDTSTVTHTTPKQRGPSEALEPGMSKDWDRPREAARDMKMTET